MREKQAKITTPVFTGRRAKVKDEEDDEETKRRYAKAQHNGPSGALGRLKQRFFEADRVTKEMACR